MEFAVFVFAGAGVFRSCGSDLLSPRGATSVSGRAANGCRMSPATKEGKNAAKGERGLPMPPFPSGLPFPYRPRGAAAPHWIPQGFGLVAFGDLAGFFRYAASARPLKES